MTYRVRSEETVTVLTDDLVSAVYAVDRWINACEPGATGALKDLKERFKVALEWREIEPHG